MFTACDTDVANKPGDTCLILFGSNYRGWSTQKGVCVEWCEYIVNGPPDRLLCEPTSVTSANATDQEVGDQRRRRLLEVEVEQQQQQQQESDGYDSWWGGDGGGGGDDGSAVGVDLDFDELFPAGLGVQERGGDYGGQEAGENLEITRARVVVAAAAAATAAATAAAAATGNSGRRWRRGLTDPDDSAAAGNLSTSCQGACDGIKSGGECTYSAPGGFQAWGYCGQSSAEQDLMCCLSYVVRHNVTDDNVQQCTRAARMVGPPPPCPPLYPHSDSSSNNNSINLYCHCRCLP
jgi:hypothetical protein